MIDNTNKKFIRVSLACIFLLVMMISFGAVNVKETFSAEGVMCYACSNSSAGSYLWGDYSNDSACEKMTVYTTKESCLANNCSGTETLDENGNCVDSSGKVTVLFKSGSLKLSTSTCILANGSCRIALPNYQNAAGWSEDASCSSVIPMSDEYITLKIAKTYTYYACRELSGDSSTSGNSSSSKKPNENSDNGNSTNSNPQTGSSMMLVIFGGGFLMMMYAIYVYKNGMKSN